MAVGERVQGSSGDDAVLTEMNALRDDLTVLKAAYDATLAKLDADAGITDTDYAATNPSVAGDAVGLTRTGGAPESLSRATVQSPGPAGF